MKKFLVYLGIFSLLLNPINSFAGNKQAEKKEDMAVYVSTILLVATAFYARDFIRTCTDEPSAMLFSLGGIYYIFGEIKNWNKFKEASDMTTESFQSLDREKNEAQIVALQKAEDQTRESERAARTRAKNAESAFSMFTIAAIVALIEGILQTLNVYTGYDDACSGGTSTGVFPKFFTPILNLLAPEAMANTNSARALGIVSAAGLAAVVGASEGLTSMSQSMKQTGGGYVRAGVFAGFAIVANQVKSMTEKAADIYKKQADEYARLKAKLIDALSKQSMEGYKKMLIDQKAVLTALQEQAPNTNCGAAGNGGDFNIDQNCSCLVTETCQTVPRPELNFKEITVPDAVVSGISDFTSMATNSYSDNNQAAELAQENLNNKASRLKKFREELEEASNKSRIANGLSPLDFKGNAKLFANQIKAKTRASISKPNMDKLADMFGFSSDLSTNSNNLISKKEEDLFKKNLKTFSAPINLKKSKKSKSPFENLLFLTESNNKEALDASKELAKYKVRQEQDIHSNKDVSIFKIISTRYLKSAFPVFFTEEVKEK